jgi:hypothetical protein
VSCGHIHTEGCTDILQLNTPCLDLYIKMNVIILTETLTTLSNTPSLEYSSIISNMILNYKMKNCKWKTQMNAFLLNHWFYHCISEIFVAFCIYFYWILELFWEWGIFPPDVMFTHHWWNQLSRKYNGSAKQWNILLLWFFLWLMIKWGENTSLSEQFQNPIEINTESRYWVLHRKLNI